MTRFVTGKKFETTVGFPTILVRKLLNLWVDLGQEKKFQTTVGLPTIPVKNC